MRSASAEPPAQPVQMPPAAATSSPAEQHADDPAEFELAFWDTVKDSDNPEMYEAYLDRYPEGAFATLAAVRLSETRGSAA